MLIATISPQPQQACMNMDEIREYIKGEDRGNSCKPHINVTIGNHALSSVTMAYNVRVSLGISSNFRPTEIG